MTTSTPPSEAPRQTWMPVTAGILNIVAGAHGIFIGIVAFSIGSWVRHMGFDFGRVYAGPYMDVFFGWFIGWGILSTVFAIVAIISGVEALRRRKWGLVLAGAILSLFLNPLLAIPSLVFAAMSRREFGCCE